MPSLPKDPIVWIDCEMTGLDVLNDTIIEIACFITDGNLNLVDINGFESVVYKPQYVLDGMNEWCINHHGKSGLTKKIQLASPESKDLEKVEQALLEYIQKYIPDKRVGVMAGNTIHMDKFFMVREFPKVIDHLHYRLIDVSTVSETCKRFNPKLADYQPRKKNRHTAKSDILESIGQLRWFRENYLKDEKEVDFDRITGSNDLARLALK